jgi:putative proteasome-type protease
MDMENRFLDRVVRYDSSMKFALKAGFLSFDATRISANDVDYPIDVVFYEKNSFRIVEKRYKKEGLQEISKNWNAKLIKSIDSIPERWMENILDAKNGQNGSSQEALDLNINP